jgi:NTP pyrophosphatase (non-canonical NTP hydrolase)
MSEIKELTEKIKTFRDERDWKQFHNPKDLAIAISVEASELLENFQWLTVKESENLPPEKLQAVKEEIADVLNYLLLISDALGIDINQAILEKIEKNAKKYPVEKAKGNAKKYTEL